MKGFAGNCHRLRKHYYCKIVFFLLQVIKSPQCANSTDFYGQGSPNVCALLNSTWHKHSLNSSTESGFIGSSNALSMQ